MKSPNFKYNEDNLLDDTFEYIKGTYGQHYVGKKEIQTLDVWESMGCLVYTSDAADE